MTSLSVHSSFPHTHTHAHTRDLPRNFPISLAHLDDTLKNTYRELNKNKPGRLTQTHAHVALLSCVEKRLPEKKDNKKASILLGITV